MSSFCAAEEKKKERRAKCNLDLVCVTQRLRFFVSSVPIVRRCGGSKERREQQDHRENKRGNNVLLLCGLFPPYFGSYGRQGRSVQESQCILSIRRL